MGKGKKRQRNAEAIISWRYNLQNLNRYIQEKQQNKEEWERMKKKVHENSATSSHSMPEDDFHDNDPTNEINCYVKVIKIGEKNVKKIFAKRDIAADEEVVFDHGFTWDSEAE